MKTIYIVVVFIIALALIAAGSMKTSPINPNCPTETPIPTEVPSITPTATETSTSVPTDTPMSTLTPIPSETATSTPTDTPTASPTDIPSETPTDMPTPTLMADPSLTPEADPSPTPTDTATQPPNTPTPVTPTPPTPPVSTETPFPPLPADAFGAYQNEYPGKLVGIVDMDGYSYSLYAGVNAPDGSLSLPTTLHGAASYKGTIWAHRIWETGWLSLKVGDIVLVTTNGKLYIYSIRSSTYQSYGKYFSDSDSAVYKYIASCYSDDDGKWSGVQLYELKLLHIYNVPLRR